MKKIGLLVLLAAMAFAERSGPYLGAGYGSATFNDGSYFDVNGYTQGVDDSSEGFRLYGGAYINKYFSVELGYNDFGEYKASNTLSQNINDSFSALGVSVLVHYPLAQERFDSYIQVGAADMNWDESGAAKRSDSAGAIILGIGGAYRFSDDFSLRVGYENYSFELLDGGRTFDWSIDSVYATFEVQF